MENKNIIINVQKIRSELAHEEEVSLTRSSLSWDVIKQIEAKLKDLQKTPRSEPTKSSTRGSL